MNSQDRIHLQINGKTAEAAAGLSLRALLEEKGVNPNTVACELNLKIIKRANLSETILQEGDQVEIIQMIGGG